MRRLLNLEYLHKVLERHFLLKLESTPTNILEVLLGNIVTHPIEDSLQPLLVDLTIFRMQVKHLHKGLSLRGLYRILECAFFLIFQHSKLLYISKQ